MICLTNKICAFAACAQGVADTYPGGPASNLMGITESDLHLSLCAR